MLNPTQQRPVRIGCYSAFWGDSAAAAVQLVQHEGANLDYLVADYLAEITMGILAARRKRRMMQGKEGRGVDFINEFLTLVLRRILPDIAKNGTKVITNAGALDPVGCKQAIEKLLKKMDITGIKVAAVIGDDVLTDKETATLGSFKEIHSFSAISAVNHHLDADRLPNLDEPIVSLNAYLGCKGVAAALDAGAHIVVTGRVVDSALVVGPLMHEYQWSPQQPNFYDLLASASLAGHIIECGCQSTGGNFTDWRLAANSPYGGYANMGYPIIEFDRNGDFIVTKPEKTGGLVTPATVSEQMVYEILDPALYLLPDVILDMRLVKLSQIGHNRVLVQGAKGSQPTPWLKCSGIFIDGWKLSGELLIGGFEAKQKAIAVGEAIIQRVRGMYKELGIDDFRNVNIEPLGAEVLYGPNASANHQAREIVLRLTAHHDDPKALGLFAMEMIPSATCMAPGITGSGTGRPKSIPNLVHFPCLLPKNEVRTGVVVGDGATQWVEWDAWDLHESFGKPVFVPTIPDVNLDAAGPLVKTKLINVAYGRSGDKGDVCNVGIIARDPKFLPFIKRSLQEKVVADYMKHLCKGTVTRFELPGSNALNFVLTRSLGGGGLSSLIIDRQGKTFAQLLLSGLDVEVPAQMVPADAKL
ncbi:uncharacterized protein BYT42DRAFT_554896 [Radiomyces spectabilis]|uniref:uncharacterized protein n=1 Tax=Radiomyces spectabilis TaxID=64574 RepID=UPI002220EFC6|nr:uncharacterized protein BYT42DRAFT_554896 [Radiomyces spectabilis]KAI8390925.1 hypothetical protein BYT42DRAFT_554896 [Radiomyces spectabilis]